MEILIITFVVLDLLFSILVGKQIGQEGLKNTIINPNTKPMFLALIIVFFLATGLVKTQELETLPDLNLSMVSIISFISSIIFFRVIRFQSRTLSKIMNLRQFISGIIGFFGGLLTLSMIFLFLGQPMEWKTILTDWSAYTWAFIWFVLLMILGEFFAQAPSTMRIEVARAIVGITAFVLGGVLSGLFLLILSFVRPEYYTNVSVFRVISTIFISAINFAGCFFINPYTKQSKVVQNFLWNVGNPIPIQNYKEHSVDEWRCKFCKRNVKILKIDLYKTDIGNLCAFCCMQMGRVHFVRNEFRYPRPLTEEEKVKESRFSLKMILMGIFPTKWGLLTGILMFAFIVYVFISQVIRGTSQQASAGIIFIIFIFCLYLINLNFYRNWISRR